MVANTKKRKSRFLKITLIFGIIFLFIVIIAGSLITRKISATKGDNSTNQSTTTVAEEIKVPVWPAILDKADYDKRLLVLDNYVPPKPILATTSTSTLATSTINVSTTTATTTKKTSATTTKATSKTVSKKTKKTIGTSTALTAPIVLPVYSTSSSVTIPGKKWPTIAPYPNGDAILPFKRILAYYGNFYSKKMGILGEYEPDEVLRRLATTTAMWETADPTTPVMPAIEYIAMVAQGSAGPDGMYRAIMPDEEIDKAYEMAQEAKGILILDLQVGLSTVQQELPKFKNYMMKPDIHLAIDPEFSMKTKQKPGTVIGTVNSGDINYVINYLSDIVKENKLPPKVLLVHRFTDNMVTGALQIKPTPEVQVVMVMDGWGSKDLKRGTYSRVIDTEPIQFTGIKLFYKNDTKTSSTGLMTPLDVLGLKPKPIYVQYQ